MNQDGNSAKNIEFVSAGRSGGEGKRRDPAGGRERREEEPGRASVWRDSGFTLLLADPI